MTTDLDRGRRIRTPNDVSLAGEFMRNDLPPVTDPKPVQRKKILTGDLRAALQPTVFIELLGPVPTIDGRQAFNGGDVVGAQYWGGGHIRLTRYPDGEAATVVAHDIQATTVTSE